MKKLWGGKLVLKGILDAEDAKIAAASGVDAIVVSNHGGRQLDGTISSIRALPEVVDAVKDKTEVWFDGGIRSGQDAQGARARRGRHHDRPRLCLRPGRDGRGGRHARARDHPRELDVSMALCGIRDVKEASPALCAAGEAKRLERVGELAFERQRLAFEPGCDQLGDERGPDR